jgi:hypothetical protein
MAKDRVGEVMIMEIGESDNRGPMLCFSMHSPKNWRFFAGLPDFSWSKHTKMGKI